MDYGLQLLEMLKTRVLLQVLLELLTRPPPSGHETAWIRLEAGQRYVDHMIMSPLYLVLPWIASFILRRLLRHFKLTKRQPDIIFYVIYCKLEALPQHFTASMVQSRFGTCVTSLVEALKDVLVIILVTVNFQSW
jgi:hypothetical protein